MAGSVDLQGVRLGSGGMKLIAPIVAQDREGLLAAIDAVNAVQPDLVEWRADLFKDQEWLSETASTLSAKVQAPLIATVRSVREGGAAGVDNYAGLVISLISTGRFAAVDLEVDSGTSTVEAVLQAAHRHGIAVIGSHHDLIGTPSVSQILDRLRVMADIGVDVAKIAVTASDPGDVLALLEATWLGSQELSIPVLTMAMGSAGVATRLVGGVFGSAGAFAKVGAGSAPGQVGLPAMRMIVDILDQR